MVSSAADFSLLYQISLSEWLTVVGRENPAETYWIWISIVCLFFLALNTVACTVDRLMVLFRTQFRAKMDVNEEFLKNLRTTHEFSSQKPAEEILSKAKSLFSRHRYRITEKKTDRGWVLFGHRGRISLLGPHLAHLGFLFFLLGHLISFFVNEKVHGLRFYESEPRIVAENLSLRLDEISFEYDPISGKPVDYESKMSVLEGENKAMDAVIGPNRPIFYQGRVFYQGPYGKDITHLEFSFREKQKQPPIPFSVPVEGEATIPGTDLKLGLGQLIPDFHINSRGEISSQSPRMNNPAIPAFLYRRGELIRQGWFFLFNPNFRKLTGDEFYIRLEENHGRTYLDLDMIRNPGAPYALAGSIMLLVGLMLGFLSSHRRLWLVCKDRERYFRLAGVASRNKGAFGNHVSRLYQQLNEFGGGEIS